VAISRHPQAVYNYMKRETYSYMCDIIKRETYSYMCDIIKIVLDG